MSDSASELAKLRAALAAAEVRADVAESELAQARAVVSCSEAMIQELKLEIAKLRRDKYGISQTHKILVHKGRATRIFTGTRLSFG